MSFFINFPIPSPGKSVKLKEISFLSFKTVNKFLINQNNLHIEEYFNEILKECLVEKDIFSELTNFDKFCALFLLRCTSISPDIEFNEKSLSIKKPLIPFLSKCLDLKTNFSQVIHIENYEITVRLPDKLYFTDIFEAMYSSIYSIYYKGSKLSFTEHEKTSIIDNLPAEITVKVKEFIEKTKNNFSSLVFDLLSTNSENILTLSPYDLSFFEILKALYTSNLKNILELQYILVSKLHYAADYIDSNTLTENLILCNIYEQELQKAKEEQDNIDKTIPLNK